MSVVALSGGVGGAKLALGLYRVLPADALTVIVNTGDDFDHLGLRVCPDLDTVLYTLADLSHPEQGWGRHDETWTLLRVLESLGGPTWFRLGDADTALHIMRTYRLRNGELLSRIIHDIKASLGITAVILPMTESRVETRVITNEGDLAFQEYFVKRRCDPSVQSVAFAGAADAAPAPGVLQALDAPDLEAIVLCPSNPYLSIDPMLSVFELRKALERRRVPLLAVCPLIGGQAVKGPTAKLMREMGFNPTAAAIAAHYGGLIDGFVIDTSDSEFSPLIRQPTFVTPTLMHSIEDKTRLARFVLNAARCVANGVYATTFVDSAPISP